MLRALTLAWADLARPGILRVVLAGIALSLLLLVLLQAGVFWAIRWFLPQALSLPYLGQVAFGNYLSWGSLLLLPLMAIFLMAPVAAAFSGLFAERVSEVVEQAHYPDHPGQPLDFWDGLLESFAVMLGVLLITLAVLVLTPFLGPLAPVLFFGANGWLLGREFFQMVALRHLDSEQAKMLRQHHSFQVTALGVMVAVLLTIPVINILVPVLAAAGFTHLYHLNRKAC